MARPWLVPVMPEKSAAPVKALIMPSACRINFMPTDSSSRKRGSHTCRRPPNLRPTRLQ